MSESREQREREEGWRGRERGGLSHKGIDREIERERGIEGKRGKERERDTQQRERERSLHHAHVARICSVDELAAAPKDPLAKPRAIRSPVRYSPWRRICTFVCLYMCKCMNVEMWTSGNLEMYKFK